MAKTKVVFSEQQQNDIIYSYRVLNQTQEEIAQQYNIGRKPIMRVLKDVKRLYEDEQWLHEQYYKHRKNKREIAELANCNEMTIHKYMKKFNMEVDNAISRKRKYDYNHNFFATIDNEQKAYWLGFIVADGGIRYEQGEKRLTILLSRKDKNHLQLFLDAIESNAEIKDRETTLKVTGKTYPQSLIRIHSAKMIQDLMSLGVEPSKSAKEKMPQIESKLIKHMIRGIFDGDGCFSYWISKDGLQCEFSIVSSLEVVTAIQQLLPVDTSIEPDGSIWKLRACNNKAITIMDWLYEDANVYLERKHAKYNTYTLALQKI